MGLLNIIILSNCYSFVIGLGRNYSSFVTLCVNVDYQLRAFRKRIKIQPLKKSRDKSGFG